ncbi:MAG: hypothetical protein HYZ27_09090 [Deltaproteobacteria bacterium]|nr:hypothetical protein [Deltaproteobacteria bacterium]
MPKLELHQVMLPWAPLDSDHHMRLASARVQHEAAEIKVAPDRLRIAERGEASDMPAPAHSGASLYTPALRSAGLPYQPHPSLADEDRAALDEQALVAAAVALDVLATRTRKLSIAPTLLADLCGALLAVGRLGGVEEAALPELLDHAASRSGAARRAMCLALAHTMARASHAAVTTPESLAAALRRGELAAALVVREARLRLEAKDKVDYRQG